MANTYKWAICALNCQPEKEGKKDVVVHIQWRRQATDGKYIGDIYGEQNIDLSPDDNFTPYDKLTPAQIEGWLEAAIGAEEIAALDAALDKQIEDQANPSVVSLPLPW